MFRLWYVTEKFISYLELSDPWAALLIVVVLLPCIISIKVDVQLA